MSTKVTVRSHGHNILWPRGCACCGQPATGTVEASGSSETSQYRGNAKITYKYSASFKVPGCRNCIRHQRIYKLWTFTFMIFVAIGLFYVAWIAGEHVNNSFDEEHNNLAVFLGLLTGVVTWGGLLYLFIILFENIAIWMARGSYQPTCSTKKAAVWCINVGSDGTVLGFADDAYAKEFIALN